MNTKVVAVKYPLNEIKRRKIHAIGLIIRELVLTLDPRSERENGGHEAIIFSSRNFTHSF
jgi:hypothetical protein